MFDLIGVTSHQAEDIKLKASINERTERESARACDESRPRSGNMSNNIMSRVPIPAMEMGKIFMLPDMEKIRRICKKVRSMPSDILRIQMAA